MFDPNLLGSSGALFDMPFLALVHYLLAKKLNPGYSSFQPTPRLHLCESMTIWQFSFKHPSKKLLALGLVAIPPCDIPNHHRGIFLSERQDHARRCMSSLSCTSWFLFIESNDREKTSGLAGGVGCLHCSVYTVVCENPPAKTPTARPVYPEGRKATL